MSTDVIIDKKIKVTIEPPKMWKIVMLNDDRTPMDFVISVLIELFGHTKETSVSLTLEIHNKGSAIIGLYSHEIADQLSTDANAIAKAAGFPLKTIIEQDD